MSMWTRIKRRVKGESGGVYRYPLERSNHRDLSGGYEGPVYTWDIDKTYLQSDFDSFKGLMSLPFEFAVDKRNVAGTDALLKVLRRTDTERPPAPLYFVSASPVQFRSVIERKMLLDGVEHDGITLKDQLQLLRAGKVTRLKEQVGYKVSALLLNRIDLPWTVDEILFGDDSESDALVYSLYADIVAGRLRGERMMASLMKNGVAEEDAYYATALAEDLTGQELVKRVLIHLEKRTAPSEFIGFSPLVVPCYDTFQMAITLWSDGFLSEAGVVTVGTALRDAHGYSRAALLRSVVDLLERQVITRTAAATLWPKWVEAGLLPPYLEVNPGEVEASDAEWDPDAWRTPQHLLAPDG